MNIAPIKTCYDIHPPLCFAWRDLVLQYIAAALPKNGNTEPYALGTIHASKLHLAIGLLFINTKFRVVFVVLLPENQEYNKNYI